MQSAKKVFSTRSTVTAVIALIIMIIAGVMFKGHVPDSGMESSSPTSHAQFWVSQPGLEITMAWELLSLRC